MNVKCPWIFLLLALLLASSTNPVRADGIIIPLPCPIEQCPPMPCIDGPCPPRPPRPVEQLAIRYHRVSVTIDNQIAVTRVDQVFHNPNNWPVEGVYVFPLPLDAAMTDFRLWIDGEPVQGEVLDAEQARQYYEETVRNLRDPALLEYEGRGAVKASVFPIQPGDERRIELEYSQVLTAENGLVRYVYPLNTEKFSIEPLEEVSVQVVIRAAQDIRAVYSPSHPVDVVRDGSGQVSASYEANNVRPDTDFALYYSLGETEAFHLFSYRDPADFSDPDGFFMLLLAPRPGEAVDDRVAKDVLLVLDRSGSMEGEKFRQAQQALRYVLQHLNPEDRFYLQAFSSGIEPYASGLREADEANEALAWVDRLEARGSTDIHRALLEAAAVVDSERPTYLIFLTDGLPTEGVVDRQQILDDFARSAADNLRTFVFGVGYDVDTFLLDTLSQEHHGQSTYVRPGEPIDETLSAFYERISTPMLTDLSLDFGALAVYDIYPQPLPDLFSGSQVVVVGRYRDGGAADVVLRGEVNGQAREFHYTGQSFSTDSRGEIGSLDALPRLWATRKIGYLLNQIRLQGPDKETIQQIVQLSVRYGIVTPYTSYLVTEPMPLGAEAQNRIVDDTFGKAQSAPMEASGQGAVERAAEEGALRSADQAAPMPQDLVGRTIGRDGEVGGPLIRVVGTRTFILQEQTWVDTVYDPQRMSAQPVVFLSEDYFNLSRSRPDIAAALALGSQVIVVVDGQAYEVVLEDGVQAPVKLPEPLPTAQPEVDPQVTSSALVTTTPAEVAQVPAQPDPQPDQPRQNPCPAGFLPLAAALVVTGLLRLRRVG